MLNSAMSERTNPVVAASSQRWTAVKRLGLVTLIGLLAYVALVAIGAGEMLADVGALRDTLSATGWYGPLAVVALMTIAVVLSPLPSAPIALAAGALYGHTWGTVYVLAGAQSGAMIAFAIARYARPAALAVWLDTRLTFQRFDSQHALMMAVCASRLLPFVSFDLVSYAAGLTPLRLWRFALATLIGILPASFALAHIGGELGSFDAGRIALSLVFLGVLGALPWLWSAALRNRRHKEER
jgi:uncharacterized membrane protein YdjX (TVP38/TMEM64 family)